MKKKHQPKLNIKPSKITVTKKKKKFSRKDSQVLTQRVKLTQEQMDRVIAESGNGEAMKYNLKGDTWEMSLELVRRLNRAKKKCKKLLLMSTKYGRKMYVADRVHLIKQLDKEEIELAAFLTFNKKEALIFYEGFDDIEIKKAHYGNKYNLEFISTFF